MRDRPSRCGQNDGMCNRYRATDVVMIRDVFGFTYIESGPPRYKTTGIGPWQPGPFVIPAGVRVGQWGMIPWFSKTQRPTGRGGRPISTNNASGALLTVRSGKSACSHDLVTVSCWSGRSNCLNWR